MCVVAVWLQGGGVVVGGGSLYWCYYCRWQESMCYQEYCLRGFVTVDVSVWGRMLVVGEQLTGSFG